ncbi:MAG: NrtA/SsuA/CpmA family ABC transporter substrate-binding protein [Caulobacter sp.]|nr:NrtA/SsuA/CpmA family ABC transporter substrate-binding protein [Vitreoscilla sp.]
MARSSSFALALAALAWLAPTAAAAEPLRIAASRAPVSLPLYVAQQRGFFADEHLEVAITDCIGGTRCLRPVLGGKAGLPTTSEMPVVLQAFAHADVAILATVAHATDNLKLIARKASGITRSEQLAGRKVGVIAGTASQYLLETHLLNVGVDPHGVTLVPMQAEDTVAALASGRIDGLAVWEPFGYAALHGVDAVGVRLPLSGGYIESYDLVGRRALFAARDDALVRLLRAVDRAEVFIQAHPAEAQAILREQVKLDQHFVDWVWGGLGFRLSLDQALLTTMEGEVRWAQREGHVAGGARPNVLTLIHPGPLRAVRPGAVGTGG